MLLLILTPIYFIILFLIIYFLFLLILNKANIGKKAYRPFINIIITGILTGLLFVLSITLFYENHLHYRKTAFNREMWFENVEERYRMAQNIIKKNILIGKTKDEVIELLGDDFHEHEKNSIGYYLGYVPGIIVIDPDVLVIYFENGIVIKVIQITT